MGGSRILLLVVLSVLLASGAQAGLITSVDRMYGESGTSPTIGAFGGNTDPAVGTFGVGNLVYSDRLHVWNDVPAAWVGAEQVLTFDSDGGRGSIFVLYVVTVSQPVTLALTVDDRIPSEWWLAPSQQAAVNLAARSWVPGTFTNSGLKAVIDEGGENLRTMSIYTADVGTGTYVFGHQPSGLNFYSIMAIPEPATLLLVGLGGLLLRRRR